MSAATAPDSVRPLCRCSGQRENNETRNSKLEFTLTVTPSTSRPASSSSRRPRATQSFSPNRVSTDWLFHRPDSSIAEPNMMSELLRLRSPRGRRGALGPSNMFIVAEELAGMPEIPSGRRSAMPHSYSKCSCCSPFHAWRISRIDRLRHGLSANLC
jgi:hypothetical protein